MSSPRGASMQRADGSMVSKPLEDLYPFDSVAPADAGGGLADPWSDKGDASASGDPGAALGTAPLPDGDAWRGGGCQTAPSGGLGGSAFTLILGVACGWWRRRRALNPSERRDV